MNIEEEASRIMGSEDQYKAGITAMKYRQELAQRPQELEVSWYDSVESVLLFIITAMAIGVIIGLAIGLAV